MPNDRSDIIRIGRAPTPAERTLQALLENAELLERVSQNLMASEHGLTGRSAVDRWRRLSNSEKDQWRERAVLRFREHAAASEDPEPPHPQPGALVPRREPSERNRCYLKRG